MPLTDYSMAKSIKIKDKEFFIFGIIIESCSQREGDSGPKILVHIHVSPFLIVLDWLNLKLV